MKASKLVVIEEGVDYTPRIDGILAYGGTRGPSVIGLHCTLTNSKEVVLTTTGDYAKTTFPPNSFITGNLYPIALAVMLDSGGGTFVGYQQLN